MMFEKAGLAALIVACSGAAPAVASPVTYDVVFTQTVGSSTQSASFDFDSTTQLFSDFIFKIEGNAVDVTAAANSGFNSLNGCGAAIVGSVGFAIMSGTTGCTSNQIWYAAEQTRDYEAQFFATNAAVDADPSNTGIPTDPAITYSFAARNVPLRVGGRFSLVAEPSGTVPEPGSIALLGLGLLAAANGVRRGRSGRR